MQGDLISERSETLAVVEQKEKSLELQLPEEIGPGIYAFESYVTYTGREALSTGTFKIVGEAAPGMIEEYGLYIFLVIIILVLTTLYFRASRKKGSVKPGLMVLILLALAMMLPLSAGQEITGSLEVLDRSLDPGDEAKALFKIRNHNFTGYRTDVFITYTLNDPDGMLIKAESGTFPVSDSRDIVFKLDVPKDSAPGLYSFKADMQYPGGSSAYNDHFEVSGPESPVMLYLITLPLIGLVFGVIMIARRKGG
jgi:hypothetical protein